MVEYARAAWRHAPAKGLASSHAEGKEVAASRSPVVPDYADWYFYERKELIMENKPKQKWLNLADLTKQDGELVMIVKAEGQTVKSYKTRIVGGKLQSLERTRLGFEPRTDFIWRRSKAERAACESRSG